jgi:hypothetical protein
MEYILNIDSKEILECEDGTTVRGAETYLITDNSVVAAQDCLINLMDNYPDRLLMKGITVTGGTFLATHQCREFCSALWARRDTIAYPTTVPGFGTVDSAAELDQLYYETMAVAMLAYEHMVTRQEMVRATTTVAGAVQAFVDDRLLA